MQAKARRTRRHRRIADSKSAAGKCQSAEVELHLVDVAPAPGFTGLDGAHDGVFGVVEVFGRVLIFRGVPAADMAALHAKAQVDPGVAHLQTLFTAFGMRLDILNLVEMCAALHRSPPLFRDYSATSLHCFCSSR